MDEPNKEKKKYVKPKVEMIDVSVKDNVMADPHGAIDAMTSCTSHTHNCGSMCTPTP